jgi:hypothetical protein
MSLQRYTSPPSSVASNAEGEPKELFVMIFRVFSSAALLVAVSSIVTACASAPDAHDGVASSEDDLKKSAAIFACTTDSDCVAVPTEECCPSGRLTAINKHKKHSYETAYACKHKPKTCPLFLIDDTRVAQCGAANKCEMVAIEDIACGGFMADPHECPSTHHCVSGIAIHRNPDVPGICVPNTCIQNVMCATDQHFDTTLCQCVDGAPADDAGAPEACGGIAGIQCQNGGTCVDDPSDSCDPNNGGADCPGICTP